MHSDAANVPRNTTDGHPSPLFGLGYPLSRDNFCDRKFDRGDIQEATLSLG